MFSDIQIEPAVVVDVDRAGVARPRDVEEARLFRDVDEAVSAFVAIEDAALGALGLQVAGEGVLERHVVLVAGARDRVRRIPSDVDEEQVEPAVAVVVEEHGARRVPGVAEARRRGDVTEAALAVVLEEHVAGPDRRDVQIRIAVVVDVGKRGRHADLARHRDTGRGGDVLEPAAADILPELVAAHLVDEVDVGEAVAIDVRNRQAVAMIVVRRLVRLAGVVDDPVLERDAALGQPVGELKIVERREAGTRP